MVFKRLRFFLQFFFLGFFFGCCRGSVLSHRLRETVPSFFASSHRLLRVDSTDTGDNSPLSSSTKSGPSQGLNPGPRWFAVGVAMVLLRPIIVDVSTSIGAGVLHLANNRCVGQCKSLSVGCGGCVGLPLLLPPHEAAMRFLGNSTYSNPFFDANRPRQPLF